MPTFLHVERFGSGPPLVALHGFGESTYTWHALRATLSARHTLYALDLKGHGQSPKPDDGRYSVHDQAGLVRAELDAAGLDGITLAGHSFGGGVALALALDLLQSAPNRLKKLILLDAASYRQPIPGFMRPLRIPVLGALVQHLVPLAVQVRMTMKIAYYDDSRIQDATVDAYTAPLRQPGALRALRDTAKQIVPADIDALTARYPTITVPTLVIWGRHDEIVPLWAGERLARELPHARLHIVEDAGHVPHEETPDEVCRALDDFLAE